MSTAAPIRSRTLVVDDDDVMRELLLVLLDLHGHDVHAVDSGSAALQWLRETAAPDLILTDMQMPGLGGGEFLAALRGVVLPSTRLVGMSGSRPRQPVLDSMDAFVLKPFGYLELGRALDGLYAPGRTSEREDAPALSAAETACNEEAVGENKAELKGELPEPAGQAPVLDEGIFQSLRETFRSQQLAELYTMTLHDVATRQSRMDTFVRAGQSAAAQREAHSIKGLCGMVGARELGALAAAVEAGTDLDTSALKEIPAACARLRRMLDTKFGNQTAPAGEHE